MRRYARTPESQPPPTSMRSAAYSAVRSGGARESGAPFRLSAALLQKHSVSQAGDPLEIEADQVAAQIMTTPAAGASLEAGASPNIGNAAGATPALAGSLGPGRPLDPDSRAFFEPRFGHDFGQVRIFDGPQAATATAGLGARAFTLGGEVAFAQGEYAPHSAHGMRVLAHELTHVVQQSASARRPAGPDHRPPIAVHRASPSLVLRAGPESAAEPVAEPARLPFEQVGNEAGAAGARHAATQLEGLLSGDIVRRALATIPITDGKQKQIVIDQILNAPATLRAIAAANKVRSLSSEEYETGKTELGFPSPAAAFADPGNDFLYVTPHSAPSAFTMGHEVSHIQTGPVGSGGADAALSFALGNVNTEVRAAFVDYAIIKLGDLQDNLAGGMTEGQAVDEFEKGYSSRISDYVARHGSVEKALGKLAVVVAARRGAQSVPTNTSALKQAVAKGFVAESDLAQIFSREISPFDVESEPFEIEGL